MFESVDMKVDVKVLIGLRNNLGFLLPVNLLEFVLYVFAIVFKFLNGVLLLSLSLILVIVVFHYENLKQVVLVLRNRKTHLQQELQIVFLDLKILF